MSVQLVLTKCLYDEEVIGLKTANGNSQSYSFTDEPNHFFIILVKHSQY